MELNEMQKNSPKDDLISVIIPCYNAEKYLAECLDSVINQDCTDSDGNCFRTEIICVDDCSTDSTPQILQQYEASYPALIMVILLPCNKGTGAARNIALTYASGNYVTYVDNDDLLLPNSLSTLYSAIKMTGSDLSQGHFKPFYSNSPEEDRTSPNPDCTIKTYDMKLAPSRQEYMISNGTNANVWCRIYRKDFLLQNSIFFYEDHFEDVYFYELCILYACKITQIEQTLYLYRIHEAQGINKFNRRDYYLTRALVQTAITVRAMKENLIRNCQQEFAFLHYMQAFYFPIDGMRKLHNPYSYHDYLSLRNNFLAIFPDFTRNKYLQYFQSKGDNVYGELLKENISEEDFKDALYGKDTKTVDILIAVAEKGGVENVIKTVLQNLEGSRFHFRIVQMVWEGVRWVPAEAEFYPLGTGRHHVLDDFVKLYQDFVRQNGATDIVLATAWPVMSYVARAGIADNAKPAKIISWLHTSVKNYDRAGYGGMDWLSHADCHFAISEEIKQELLSAHPNWNVLRVYNPAGSSRQIQKYSLQNPAVLKFNLLFVGRLSEEKNIPYLLRTLAQAPKWNLQIVGAAETEAYEKELKQLAKELGVENRVSWLGWQEDPWKFATDADALVLSSLYEGFALVAIEAMSLGLPVLSANVEGCRELITDGKNGYLYDLQSNTALSELLGQIEQTGYIIKDRKFCRETAEPYETERAIQDFGEKLRYC